jgi:hypothetical protein
MTIDEGNRPPTDSAVVGEKKDDPDQLLLMGDNGEYYAYSIPDDTAAAVEPNEDWIVEETDSESLFA